MSVNNIDLYVRGIHVEKEWLLDLDTQWESITYRLLYGNIVGIYFFTTIFDSSLLLNYYYLLPLKMVLIKKNFYVDFFHQKLKADISIQRLYLVDPTLLILSVPILVFRVYKVIPVN